MAQPTYDVATHDLLTGEAQALTSDDAARFGALNVLAEHVLGLRGTSFTGGDEETAMLAVARQVNLLVKEDPEQQLLEEKSQGERRWRYRAKQSPVDAVAKRLADSLTGNGRTYRSQTVESTTSWV